MELYRCIVFLSLLYLVRGYYGLDGFDGHLYKRSVTQTRHRQCPAGYVDTCYFCDCYRDGCYVSRKKRMINQFYKGLFLRPKEVLPPKIFPMGTDEISHYGSASEDLLQRGQIFHGCCETEQVFVSHQDPIDHEGTLRLPVTVSSSENVGSNQFYIEGKCVFVENQPITPCGTNGRCVQMKGRFELLVHNEINHDQYEFISIDINTFCRCSFSGFPGK